MTIGLLGVISLVVSHIPRGALTPIIIFLALCTPLRAQFGSLDPSFAVGSGPDAAVHACAAQSDGSVIIAGEFTNVHGIPRGRIARLLADGSVDPSFASGAGADGVIRAMLVVGTKLVVVGDFTSMHGTPHGRIARLSLLDGTVDSTFVPDIGANGPIFAVIADTSNGYYIGGEFTSYRGTTRNRVARIQASGALNTLFNAGTGPSAAVLALALYNSGIAIGGAFTSVSGQPRGRLAVLSSGGTLDPFATFGTGANDTVRAIRSTSSFSSSQYFIGGNFTTVNGVLRGRIAQIDPDGIVDSKFNFGVDAPVHTFHSSGSSTSDLIVGGNFTSMSGASRHRIARLIRVGSFPYDGWEADATFNNGPGPDGTVFAITKASDGRFYAGGQFTHFDNLPKNRIARLYSTVGSALPGTPTGLTVTAVSHRGIMVQWFVATNAVQYFLERSIDGSTGWTVVTSTASTIYTDNSLLAGTTNFYRVQGSNLNGVSPYSSVASATTESTAWTGPGSLDPSIIPFSGPNGSVEAVALQPDGKILIGGSFTTVHGNARNRIARLHPDWSVDTSFNPGTGPNSTVTKIAVLPDGDIMILGYFSSVAGIERIRIARLNSDGTPDLAFVSRYNPSFTPDTLLVQPDGLTVLSGISGWERLKPDGTPDSLFYPSTEDSDAIALLSDGKFLTSGFRSPGGFVLTRLHPDGRDDEQYSPLNLAFVSEIMQQNDGRILVGGSFTSVGGITRRRIARLTSNGILDTSFDSGTGPDTTNVEIVAVQSDSKVFIGGNFNSFAGIPTVRMARLTSSGLLDLNFKTGAGANASVAAFAVQEDGKIIVAGSFTTFDGEPYQGLVRLLGDTATEPPPVPTNLTVTTVSGSELRITWSDVVGETRYELESSPDGVSGWNEIATPAYDITHAKESGLPAKATRYYRLRSYNTAGFSTYSAVANGTTLDRFSQWNLDNGFPANTDIEGDLDRDGMGQLMEFALNRNPHNADNEGAITSEIIGNVFTLQYHRARGDLVYTVESSNDLQTWTAIGVNQGSGVYRVAWVPMAGSDQRFLRLSVRRPE